MLSLHSCPCSKLGSRYTGGMNIYIKNLSEQLEKNGHYVDIYTCSHERSEDCNSIISMNNVNLIHIPIEDFSTIDEDRLYRNVAVMAESIILYSTFKNLHYDIIHSHYWLSGMVGSVLKEFWNIPHVTMFHTLARIKNEVSPGYIEPSFRIIAEENVMGSCDLIIASTEKEKAYLIDKYRALDSKITVIPCGVNTDLFKPVNKDLARKLSGIKSSPNILFVGRDDPIKGLDNLLMALSLLKMADGFTLTIIGGDDSSLFSIRNTLRQKCNSILSDHINLIGPVPHEQMVSYYNTADFCVIPSYYESFSLVALESVACGVPVLSTDVGDVRHISASCPSCIIISSNNPDTIARGIKDMLNIKKETNYKSIPDRYRWRNIVNKIIQHYFELRLQVYKEKTSAQKLLRK